MADDTTTTPDTDTPNDDSDDAKCDSCGLPAKTGRAFKELKAELSEKDERIEKLSSVALSNGIAAAGFELVTVDEEGNESENKMLELVTREFVREHPEVEEFDPKVFTEFASTYGVAPSGDAEGGQPSGSSEAGESQAGALAQMQGQGDALRQASQQVQPAAGLEGEIAQAEADGDVAKSKALKQQKMSRDLLRFAQQPA